MSRDGNSRIPLHDDTVWADAVTYGPREAFTHPDDDDTETSTEDDE